MNLQLDHFMIKPKNNNNNQNNSRLFPLRSNGRKFLLVSEQPESSKMLLCRVTHTKAKLFSKEESFVGYARLPQRVAMDDLASYFVEERSKVR